MLRFVFLSGETERTSFNQNRFYPMTFLFRRAFEHDKDKPCSSARENLDQTGTDHQSADTMPQHHRHSLTAMQQEPSTSSETPTSVDTRVPSVKTLPPLKTHKPDSRDKRLSFLGEAFSNTVGPSSVSFAPVKDDDKRVKEEDEKLHDPDVLAMVTDF